MKAKKSISLVLAFVFFLSILVAGPNKIKAAANNPVEKIKLSMLPDNAYLELITSAYTLGDGPEVIHKNWFQSSYSSTDRLYSMATGTSNTIGDGFAVKIQKDNNNAYLMIDAADCSNIVARYWLKDATNANDISEVIQVSYDGGDTYQPLPDKSYPSARTRVHRLAGADNNSNVRLRIIGSPDIRQGHIVWFDNLSIFSDTTAPTWDNSELTATAVTDTGMTLSWNGASDNTKSLESGVKYYRIYNGETLMATVTDDVYYNVSGLNAGTSYTFTVKAGDTAGNWSDDGVTGSFSTISSADTTPPQWVSNNLNVSHLGQKNLTLSWDGATDETALLGYRVYKNDSLLSTVSADVYKYDVNNLEPGISYTFKIEAEDIIGNLSANGPSKAITTLNAGSHMFSEDFEGADPLSSWTLSLSGGLINVADDPIGKHGKSLEIVDTSGTNSTAARYSFGQKTGVVTAEYRFMHKDEIKTMYLPFYGSVEAGADREFFRLSSSANKILTYGNDAGAYTNISEIMPNQWYYAKVVVDIVNKVSMFRVEGEDGTIFISGRNNLYGIVKSPYVPLSINQLGFYTKSTETATLYIDDVKIYDTDMSTDKPVWLQGSSISASETGKKEITLTWDVPEDYLGINKYNIYKDDSIIGTVNGNTNSYTAAELEPGTSYLFKVEAEDASGNKSETNLQLQHSTLPKDETVPPVWPEGSSLTALDVDANNLRLTWTPASDNTGVIFYKIYKNGSLIETVSGSTLSYVVTGLEMSTEYEFSVKAGDESDNWSQNAISLKVSTIGDIKAPVWISPYFGMTRDTNTTGVLSFNMRGATDNVSVTQYRVYEGDILIASVPAADDGNRTGLVTISGLTPGEKHTYTVCAGDAAGNWSTDNPKVSFRTYDNTLPVWQSDSLSGSSITASSITLNWSGAEDNGFVKEYRVYRDGILESVVPGDVQSYIVKGLLHDTEYAFSIQAVDGLNNESKNGPSAVIVTAHSEDTTAPVWSSGTLTANEIMPQSIRLQWSGAEDNNEVAGYRILNGNEQLAVIYENISTYELADLTPGMEYIFKVEACDAAGNWSENGPVLTAATILISGETKYVDNIEELNSSIAGANPGDVIVLRDGVYDTGLIAPVTDKHGKPNARIVIRAANPGMAEIKATTGFDFINCSYITVEGIKFTGKQTVELKDAAINMLGCNNMRITRCHIMLDETEAGNGFSLAWVTIKSQDNVVSHHNRVDRNLFEKKLAPGVILSIDGDWESQQISQYDVIEYNHFKDSKPRISNGKESIRYGTSFNSQSRAFGLVQYNLFEECDGDPEILSIKSSDVTARYNTFFNSMGQVTFRHGDRDTIYGNYFIGDGKKSDVGGLRIYGTDHRIFSNYFYGLTGPTMQIDGGDSYNNGMLTDKWTVRRTEVSFNTIVDCSTGITIWGGREYAPQDLTVSNNLIVNSGGINYSRSKSAVAGIPTPRPIYEGNISYPTLYPATKTELDANDPAGEQEIQLVNPMLTVYEGVYRLSAGSPAIDAARGIYNHVFSDIDGQLRTELKDIGADEYSGSLIVNKPLTAADVGLNAPSDIPQWISGTLTVSEITESKAELTWSKASDDRRVTLYKLYNGGTQIATVMANVNSITINNLAPDTNYSFKVLAGDEDSNWSNDGPSVTFKTLQYPNNDGDTGSGNPGNPANGGNTPVQDKDSIKVTYDNNSREATAVISNEIIKNEIDKAKKDEKGNLIIKLEIPEVKGANSYIALLDANALSMSGRLEIRTALGSLRLPENLPGLLGISKAGNIEFEISAKDAGKLSDDLKSKINGRPFIELSTKFNGNIVKDYSPGTLITVSIPYEPSFEELENEEFITVWQLNEIGEKLPVYSARYNRENGMVTFTAELNGNFAVVYNKKTFDDITEHAWAKKQIEVLASKGIINGKSELSFDPEANITRADFTVLLVKVMGLSARVESNFNDIDTNDYYYEAVGIAKALRLAKGKGDGSFNPDEEISRQDMMTIIARAMLFARRLEGTGETSDLSRFADNNEISAYAQESIALLVSKGLIKGSDGMINPLNNASRAETAVILYRIYNVY